MCGIAGFLTAPEWPADVLRTRAQAMADSMVHRGPDDGAVWVDEAAGLALGFRRLAIIDLSEQGRQPMTSASGRYVIVLNGEIYNFEALRVELTQAGMRFRGHSDVEVALGVIERDGIRRSLQQFNGMFACAIWDRHERVLTLARDRFGEKPLYYGRVGGHLLFGSELKALCAHPAMDATINTAALREFFRYGYVPAPHSIYRGIMKLPPASFVTVPADLGGDLPTPVPFWSAAETANQAAADPFRGSEDEAVDALDAALRDAVRLRMVSDVPLGAFLSGGIDSSTVVSLMQAQSTRPVRTFTIGFNETGYDEARHASAVAAHLGTDHTELYIRPAQAQSVIPQLSAIYDEPFADSSQIPTLLVSQLARRHVTVALSGDGGDELFGGYNRYMWATKIWRARRAVPGPLAAAVGRSIGMVPPGVWDAVATGASSFLPRKFRVRMAGEKLHKLGAMIRTGSAPDMYRSLVSTWHHPESLVVDAGNTAADTGPGGTWDSASAARQSMMLIDTTTYLPDDILTKVDRASMAVSLEARVPMLDPEVFALAWRLPEPFKIKGTDGKRVLRRVLSRYVPPSMFERPKMGFAVPVGAWLRGPLASWAEDLLDPARLRREGWLHPAPVEKLWRAHQAGRVDAQYHLWSVLMFEAWLASARR